MALLPCDICGKKSVAQGSWDTPIKIVYKDCYEKEKMQTEKAKRYFKYLLKDGGIENE